MSCYHDPHEPSDELKAIIEDFYSYDEETGDLISKRTGKPIRAKNDLGYLYVVIGKRPVRRAIKIHHIAFFFHHGRWPRTQLDHIDRDKTNNRASNLREADSSVNNLNKDRRRGTREYEQPTIGISFHKGYGKFQARLEGTEKRLHIGYFDTEEEAIEALIRYKNDKKDVLP